MSRIENEIAAVVELMAIDHPGAADWNVVEDDHVEVLDSKDKVLAVITSDKLTEYWNKMEGVAFLKVGV